VKALVFNIRLNSLYSIRIPFTWQSALTYPILPPSGVIGMLANALQRYKNDKHPLEYLNMVENNLLWAGSRLIKPCVIRSYTTSAIVKWDYTLGGKFTNALGRQYAYSQKLQIAAIFNNDDLIIDISSAIKNTPLTCGDSESLISLDGGVNITVVEDVTSEFKDKDIETTYPVPFTKDTKIEYGNGKVYLMHERCKKQDNHFPLVSYIIPVREEQKILNPSYLKVRVSDEKVFKIDGIGFVLARAFVLKDASKNIEKKKRRKK
jgi:CRISPR-associated Cas5-like protein